MSSGCRRDGSALRRGSVPVEPLSSSPEKRTISEYSG